MLATNNLSDKRILLVEDDVDILEALQELLESEGYTVLCATNGLEALQVLRTQSLPTLILLDLMMPVMDGYQFCHAKKEDPRLAQIPVVVMSADGQVEKKIAQIGIPDFLKKPVELEAVLANVRRFCS